MDRLEEPRLAQTRSQRRKCLPASPCADSRAGAGPGGAAARRDLAQALDLQLAERRMRAEPGALSAFAAPPAAPAAAAAAPEGAGSAPLARLEARLEQLRAAPAGESGGGRGAGVAAGAGGWLAQELDLAREALLALEARPTQTSLSLLRLRLLPVMLTARPQWLAPNALRPVLSSGRRTRHALRRCGRAWSRRCSSCARGACVAQPRARLARWRACWAAWRTLARGVGACSASPRTTSPAAPAAAAAIPCSRRAPAQLRGWKVGQQGGASWQAVVNAARRGKARRLCRHSCRHAAKLYTAGPATHASSGQGAAWVPLLPACIMRAHAPRRRSLRRCSACCGGRARRCRRCPRPWPRAALSRRASSGPPRPPRPPPAPRLLRARASGRAAAAHARAVGLQERRVRRLRAGA